MGSTDLFAQPIVKDIQRYRPTAQNTSNSEIYWLVSFSDPINGKTIGTDDFKLTTVSGSFDGSEFVMEVSQNDKSGYEWIVGAGKVSAKNGTIRLDFNGYVENTKGTPTDKGYKFEKGQTYIYGDGGITKGAEVSAINRNIPSQQNISAQNVSWLVYFTDAIDAKTLTTDDFTLTKTGSSNGTVTGVTALNSTVYKVDLSSVSGIGNLRLDFTGAVTSAGGDISKNKFTTGMLYSILDPVAVTSINRYSPSNQVYRGSSVTYMVTFNRAMNAGTVNTTDFLLTALAGQVTGAITSVSGSGTIFYVTVSGITKDVTLRLDANGSFTDTNPITNNATFYTGDTYMIDFTSPTVTMATIHSNNLNPSLAIPENTITVDFRMNEPINILSAKINGKVVSHNGSGSSAGSAQYTYLLSDPQGLATFEFVIQDLAGNPAVVNKTTDGSFVKFEIPTPDVVIIEQPHDVIACEGSTDKYLFVVAAPDLKGFNIAYRWWKDGRPISGWVQDFGQLSLDTLRYKMSGTYKAEMFVFDPKYDGGSNNGGMGAIPTGFRYEDARVSPIVFSDEVNLYVLQKPSFMHDINSITAAIGSSVSITFEAHIYGEHNMEDPTYWTQIQWFRGNTALTDDQRYEGAQSSIFNIENVQATDYATDYRVRLIGECDTTWSNYFAIGEQPYATITVQPISVEGCVGDVAQLSVEADPTLIGTILTYQWSVNGNMITDEAGKFNGTNSPNLNVTLNTDLAYNGTEKFTCKVWPVGFPSNGVVSNPAMITWKTAPTITSDLSAVYTVKEDENIELSVTADGANLTYTWTKDGVDLANNNNKLAITMATMTNAGEYVVTVSNDCGEVTSATATLTVTPGPVVLTGVNEEAGLGLSQNYPNPFADNSTMSFNPQTSGNATVVMTDLLGNVIANLYSGNVAAGTPTPININGMNLNSGTYFITLRMGDKVETRQISVVR